MILSIIANKMLYKQPHVHHVHLQDKCRRHRS
nr:MAG TPA: hypothetical protein [Bacteriophage sp.]